MKFSSSSSIALVAALVSGTNALGQNATVSLTPGKGLFQLAGSGINGQILVSANDWWGVLRAAEDLAGDVGKVVGKNLTLGNWMASGPGKRGFPDLEEGNVLQVEGRDVSAGPKGGSPGEGGSGFPSGGHSGGWGWGGGNGQGQSGVNPPGSPGHNVTSTASSGTTVYYTFNPVTSFINVSYFALYFMLTWMNFGDEGCWE